MYVNFTSFPFSWLFCHVSTGMYDVDWTTTTTSMPKSQ